MFEDKRYFLYSYEKKKKTELCKNWDMFGYCKFGDQV